MTAKQLHERLTEIVIELAELQATIKDHEPEVEGTMDAFRVAHIRRNMEHAGTCLMSAAMEARELARSRTRSTDVDDSPKLG